MKTKNSNREERLAAALRENLKRRKVRERVLAKGPSSKAAAPAPVRPNKAQKAD